MSDKDGYSRCGKFTPVLWKDGKWSPLDVSGFNPGYDDMQYSPVMFARDAPEWLFAHAAFDDLEVEGVGVWRFNSDKGAYEAFQYLYDHCGISSQLSECADDFVKLTAFDGKYAYGDCLNPSTWTGENKNYALRIDLSSCP